jgi:hypothetical protein
MNSMAAKPAIGNREEEDAGAELPVADHGQVDHCHLARSDHVGQEQDGDEGSHYEIEIAQARAAQRAGFDLLNPLAHFRRLARFRY